MVKRPRKPGKAVNVARAKDKKALEGQNRALGGFKARLEALYGIRKDAK